MMSAPSPALAASPSRKSRRRPQRRQRWKCISNLESLLLGSLVSMALILVTVNLSLMRIMEDDNGDGRSTTTNDAMRMNNNNNINNALPPRSLVLSQSQSQSRKANKEPLLEILRLANITSLTDQEWESLPSWEQVVQRFGDHPRIIGLETCETYRQRVPLRRRHVAPSGMFSTGTNLLYELLHRNCILSPSRPRNSRNTGVDWQVNWGKHQSPRFRHVNNLKNNINNSEIFPIVMVRDPWTWLQSMCRVRYSAHWFHVEEHCPNFIPNHVEREWYPKNKQYVQRYFHNDPWKVDNVLDKGNFTLDASSIVPVWVRYKNENAFHDSIAHFWKDWNQEYFDAVDYVGGAADADTTSTKKKKKKIPAGTTTTTTTFPRLMVRLEDLVFFPQIVLKEICDCVGGQLVADPLVLVGDTSKQGGENVHGSNKTDLRAAMMSHVYTNRSRGMTQEDMDYASQVLQDSPVLQRLGYSSDPRG